MQWPRGRWSGKLRRIAVLASFMAIPTTPLVAVAQEESPPTAEATAPPKPAAAPPAKALKYHGALLRRPNPGYLFDRFFNAWLDEASVADLEAFLKEQGNETAADGLLLAFFYAKQGDEVLAIEQFRKTLNQNPDNAAAWYEKAVLEARTLDFETALTDLSQAAEASKKANTQDAQLAMRIAKLRGQLLVRSRKREEALKVFQELVAANPEDEELAEDVIELQLGEGLYDEAAKAAEQLIERTKDPYRKVLRRLRLGDVRGQAGQREQAIEIYQATLVDVGAESWLEREILSQIERSYRREEDIPGLKKQYQKLLEDFPRRVGVRRGYARVLVDSGESQAAIEQFKEILKITPGDRANQEAFIQLYLRTGDNAGARKQLAALIEQNPDDGELYVQLADLAKKTNDKPAAVKAVGQFLERSDKSEYAYLRAARLLERLEYANEAKQSYSALTKAFPDSPAAKEAAASFLYKSGAKDEAIALWKQAAEGDEPQQAVRVARALAARQEHAAAFELLNGRRQAFADDPLFLAQLVDEALALKKYEEALPLALRRVDLAESPSELDDAVAQAAKVIERGEKLAEELARLRDETTTSQRTCLLAELLERSGDVQQADAVLQGAIEAGDLLAVSQKIRLAQQRRDWRQAIEATRVLIDLPNGRKSRNVRRLVEFYERDFQIAKALEWIPEWKKLSPGSTSPWLTESRLLLIDGKDSAAVDVLRAAAREFDGADEIRTRLAQLYQSTGKLADAERIYWRAYEDADDLVGKLRAVEQLARTAEQQGKTATLVANFEERRRARRTSIEPLMALSTIYRTTDNYEKRLQTLAEAAKMRPDDLQLLRQIARIEEREGDWERARDTLQRAMKLDKTGRTRQQLASLHLRWGNAEEGYALLQQAIEENADDPREVEAVADAMIAAGDWERATEFLEPRVAKWGDDYRLRYLLATAQEESASLSAAAEQFLQVLAAEQEVSSAAATLNQTTQNAYYEQLYSIAPPGVKELIEARQLQHHVYSFRQQRNRGMPFSTGSRSNVTMPSSVAQAQQYALVHLTSILQLLEVDEAESIREAVANCDVPEAEVIMGIGGLGQNQNVSAVNLLEKFPERDSVTAYIILGMGGRTPGIEAKFYSDAVGHFAENYPQVALIAAVQGMMLHEENKDLATQAMKLLNDLEKPSSISVMMLCTMPAQLAQRGSTAGALPKAFDKQLRGKLLDWYPLVRNSQPYGQWIFNYMANMLRTGDDPKAYVKLLSDEVARFRQDPRQTAQNMSMFGRRAQSKLLSEPTFPPTGLQRFPMNVMSLVSTRQGQRGMVYFPGQQHQPGWEAKEFAAMLPEVKDPTLRLLLAHSLEKEEVVEKAIEQLLAAPTPTLDAYLIAAGWAVQQEKPEEAVELLAKARYLPMDRATRRVVDGQLLSLVLDRVGSGIRVATGLDEAAPEEIVKLGREAALRLRHGTLQPNDRTALASALDELGLKKEAERLENNAAAIAARPAMGINIQAYSSTPQVAADRIRKLIDSKKSEAAAKLLSGEVLNLIRQQGQNYGNISYNNYQYRQLRQRVEKYGLEGEVLESLDPGDSTNHRRHAEYAAALEIFGEEAKSIKAYARALELRPNEDAYRVQLIAAEVRGDRLSEATARLADFGRRGPGLLIQQLLATFQDHETDLDTRLRMGQLALALFEQEAKKTRGDLAWAPTFRRNLSNPQHTRGGANLPGLYVKSTSTNSNTKGSKNAEERRRLHDKLCSAMLEVDYLAADGFTGLLAAEEASARELDETALSKFRDMAAAALKQAKRPPPSTGQYSVHRIQYSTTSQVVQERSPGEFLVRYCYTHKDWSSLDDDVLPHLEEHGGAAFARDIKEYRSLYDCPAEEFPEVAKAFVRRSGQPHNPSVSQSQPQMQAYEAWRDRKLAIDIQPVMLGFVKQSLLQANPQGVLPFVLDYTESLATQEGPAAAADWLEELAEAYIGPRDKRQDLIAKNYQRNNIRWGSPNAAIHGFANTLQQCLQKGPLMLPAMRFMAVGKVDGLVRNYDSSIRNGLRQAMPTNDADETLEFLDAAGLLSDPPELKVGEVGSGGEAFYAAVRNHLKRYTSSNTKNELGKKLAERKEQTLGVQILRVSLEDDEAQLKELVLQVGNRLDELNQLPPKYRTALAAQLGGGIDKLKGNLDAVFGDATSTAEKAFDWLEAQQTALASNRVESILSLKRFEELKTEIHELDDWLGKRLPEIAQADPDGAAKVYFKVIDLYEDAIKRNAAHQYYGGATSTELARQMTYRMDRESPQSALVLVALLEGDHENRITMSESDIQNFLRPLGAQLARYQQQARKAKAGPVDIIKPYYIWLRETFGKNTSPVLAASFINDFQRFSHKDLEKVETWLAGQVITADDGGLANDLLAAARLRKDRNNRNRSGAEPFSRTDDDGAYDYYEKIVSDKKRSLAVRLGLASILYERQRDRLPLSTAQAIMEVGAEACGTEIPFNYSLERCLSSIAWELTNQAAEASTTNDAAQQFIAAWIKRFGSKSAIVNSRSNNTSRASDSSSILKMMAACYAQGDKESAKKIYRTYGRTIARYHETLGLLVREGEIADAATLVRNEWSNFSLSSLRPSPVAYDERLQEGLQKLKEKLGAGPMSYFAELTVSGIEDVSKEEREDRWPAKEDRLRELAGRFHEAGLQSTDMIAKAVLMFRGDDAATDLVAEPLKQAAAQVDLVKMARGDDPKFQTGLQLVLQHGEWAVRHGDPRPLTSMFVKIMEAGIDNDWRLQNAYSSNFRNLADALTKNIGKLDEKSLVALTDDMRKLAAAPDNYRIYEYWKLNTLMVVAHARYGSLETYKPWFGSFKKDTKERVRREGTDAKVFELTLEDLDKNDPETLDKRIERLAGLMELLSWSGWIHRDPQRDASFKSRGGTRILRPMEVFFTKEELQAAAPAVAERAPGHAGVTWMIAAKSLEKVKAYAEAAAAWGKSCEHSLDDEAYKGDRDLLMANQIQALLQAGMTAEATKQLHEALEQNIPTPRTKRRYDRFAELLNVEEADESDQPNQDKAPPPARNPEPATTPNDAADEDPFGDLLGALTLWESHGAA